MKVIKIECINNPSMNCIIHNSVDEDVARFYHAKMNCNPEDIKFFYFDMRDLVENEYMDLSQSGNIIIKKMYVSNQEIEGEEVPLHIIAQDTIVETINGIEGSYPYNENMKFVGYGFSI